MSKTQLDYLVFDNPDKRDRSEVSSAALSWPWRHCVTGPPGSGKRVLLLNQAIRMPEKPARVIVIHLDKSTHEYDKIADEIYSVEDMPDFGNLSGDERTLLILDELQWATLPKDAREKLSTFFRYGSTHKNTSIALLYQVFSKIPVEIRRMCSAFSLFPGVDRQELPHLANCTGIDVSELKTLLCLTRGRQECITIDCSVPADHEYRYRLCFVWPITRDRPVVAASKSDAPLVREGGAIVVVPPPSSLPAPEAAAEVEGSD